MIECTCINGQATYSCMCVCVCVCCYEYLVFLCVEWVRANLLVVDLVSTGLVLRDETGAASECLPVCCRTGMRVPFTA